MRREIDEKGLRLGRWLKKQSRSLMSVLVLLCGMVGLCDQAQGFSYLFAKQHGVDIITHASGYTGVQKDLYVTVGVNPGSLYIDDLLLMTQNVVRTWNGQTPVVNNRSSGESIDSQMFDMESIILHEMGHAIGMDHPNLGVEGDVFASHEGLAMSTLGSDGKFNYIDENSLENADQYDGILGSADDYRGDDVNLNYFNTATNNPFTIAGVVDQTTYSRNLSELPSDHAYSAVGSKNLSLAVGGGNSQTVMHQVFSPGTIQRELSFDDVAGVSYAESGLDHLWGTSDDYRLTLIYGGVDANADIVIDYGDVGLASGVLANTLTEGGFIPGTFNKQAKIHSARIQIPDSINWHISTESNAAVPTAVYGDFNGDLIVDGLDVGLLSSGIDSESDDLLYDLTGDGLLDHHDSYQLVNGVIDALPGDFNLDGLVNLADLIQWAQGFGQSSSFSGGDGNHDGKVNIADLIEWATSFGQTKEYISGFVGNLSAESAAIAIPEPSSLCLVLGLGGMIGVTRRRRKLG